MWVYSNVGEQFGLLILSCRLSASLTSKVSMPNSITCIVHLNLNSGWVGAYVRTDIRMTCVLKVLDYMLKIC